MFASIYRPKKGAGGGGSAAKYEEVAFSSKATAALDLAPGNPLKQTPSARHSPPFLTPLLLPDPGVGLN